MQSKRRIRHCDRPRRLRIVTTRNVSVIDVGSNTIKLLIATSASDGSLVELHQISDPTRIGVGIGSDCPTLSGANMQAGLASIKRLLEHTQAHSPCDVRIVATGAVRDAINGKDFARLVLDATGHRLAILSGEEEATGIATGVSTDPALVDDADFLVCDLGGGSLELILTESRSATAMISLPLGAVRLTEYFIADARSTIPEMEMAAISKHVTDTLIKSEFPFPATSSKLIATGGSFVTARALFAERESISFENRSKLDRQELAELLKQTSSLTFDERLARFPTLSPNRADVMPAALACILALLDHVRVHEVRNSLRNLRYGIAAKLLAETI